MKIKKLMILGSLLLCLLMIPLSFASEDIDISKTSQANSDDLLIDSNLMSDDSISSYNYDLKDENSFNSEGNNNSLNYVSNHDYTNYKGEDFNSISNYNSIESESNINNNLINHASIDEVSTYSSDFNFGISVDNVSDYFNEINEGSVANVSADSSNSMPSVNFNLTFNGLNGLTLSDANTIYVNASYTGTIHDGTQAQPYTLVEDAFSTLNTKPNLFIANGTYTVNHINPNRNLNIIGESTLNTILTSSSNIFNFTSQHVLVNILNLTFANAKGIDESAIYNKYSILNLVNLLFKDNSLGSLTLSKGGAGGAIYNEYGVINAYNTSFINNSVLDKGNGYGGALCNYMGNITLVDCIFDSNGINSSYGCGGAIYNIFGDLATFNTSFVNNYINSSYGSGGAICNYAAHDIFILNSTISNNNLNGDYTFGSAISNKAIVLELINSTVSNNHANGIGIENGTIYNFNGLYYCINSTMSGNTVRETKENMLLWLKDQFTISNDDDISSTVELPDSYDLRDLNLTTPVKNQGSSGSCWSFAMCAALESYLLKTENITYDFSENNMKNIMGKYSINGTDFDTNLVGGNWAMALAYLLRWSGTINETQDPYNAGSKTSSYDLVTTKHLQDILFVPLRTSYSDLDQIKLAIMNYGALYSTMYSNSSALNSNEAYYSDIYHYSNHAISIVGWDDNYSASNFDITPPGDGAFIIKNSWGNYLGDEGYWYISYYDKSISGLGYDTLSAMAVTNLENASNYKENYQYDILGNTYETLGYNCETAWFANQFTSNSNNPLAAFGLYTFSSNSKYQTQIYVNGQLKYSQNGTIDDAGYHTVKLNKYIDLATGDTFKVVVKLTSPGSLFPIAIESNRSGYSSKASSELNQSFISPDGVNWYDIAQTTEVIKFGNSVYNSTIVGANVCLKAYTAYASDLVLSINSNTSTYNTGDLVEINLNLTNLGDDANNINISSILDAHASLISANAINGSYNLATKVWTLNNLNTNESALLKLVLSLSSNNTVTNTFNIASNTYNLNNNTSVSSKIYYSSFTKIIGNNMTTTPYSNESISLTLLDASNNPLANKNIHLTLNGLDYNLLTDNNGVISLAINLSEGNYTLFAEFLGGSDLQSSNINLSIVVKKLSLIMIANNYSGVYGTSGNFTAKLVDEFGNPMAGFECKLVLMNYLGETRTYDRTTNSEGIVKLAINLIAANWTITAYFPGNNKYAESTHSVGNLTIVDNVRSIMLAYNYTAVYGNPGNFTAKLTDSNGNVLSGYECLLTLKNIYGESKTYYRTTNTEGIVKLAINLIAANWTITAYYPGSLSVPESNNSTGTLIISSP